ncbi:MAG: hypothetical protein EOP87_19105, partial [Verrucomicrobiaceae bacterium]
MNNIGIIAGGFTAYPALDIGETRRFYGEIFGLKEGMVSEYEGKAGWVEFDIPGGHTLAIAQA